MLSAREPNSRLIGWKTMVSIVTTHLALSPNRIVNQVLPSSWNSKSYSKKKLFMLWMLFDLKWDPEKVSKPSVQFITDCLLTKKQNYLKILV